MRIIQYKDANGSVGHASLLEDGTANRLSGDIYGEYQVTDETVTIDKLLAPIAPTSILCVGLNYQAHAEESGAAIPEYPVIFMKGPNTVQNPGEPIVLPTALASHKVDYECELAVVIAKTCRNVPREEALDYVLGYTCANDVSARDWQIEWGGGQWCRGKMFDTFCPLGPCLTTTDEIPDPNALAIKTTLNGELMQNSNTRDMIFDVPTLIAFLSGSTTLLRGTVILTGTPQGVGMARQPPRWLQDGDEVTVEVEGIGALTNPVATEG